MRFKQLDLNLLVALDTLLEEQNVSRAAVRLNLSQSATSNALARLRSYFKDDLLVPIGQRLVPTQRALELRQPIREVLIRIDIGIVSQPAFNAAESTRHISMLVSDYTTAVFMPSLLRTLHQHSPGIHVRLLLQSRNPHELIENGRADFLIIPEKFVSPSHPFVPLFEDEYVVVAWNQHPRLQDKLTVAEYNRSGHVGASFGEDTNQNEPVLESWFLEKAGVKRRIEITAPSLAALPGLVVGTDRLTTIHSRLAYQAASYLPVKIWPAPLKLPKFVQMLQWNRYRSSDAGLEWIKSLCLTVGKEV